ncbi:MAG: hypothetical protein K2G25_08750, partial [Oscillospiraceae bacterium]|nr:hypothetical protein [Oscillospiraceae bacterium]
AFALSYPNVLKHFIDTVYEEHKEKIPFSVRETSFQEVLDAYDQENYLCNTIFLFKKAKERVTECRQEFSVFLKSQLFRDILQGRYVSTKPEETPGKLLEYSDEEFSEEVSEETEFSTEISGDDFSEVMQKETSEKPLENLLKDLSQELSEISPKESQNPDFPAENSQTVIEQNLRKKITQSEEKIMKLYGRIDYRSGYYNFAPQYEEKNAEFIELRARDLFPPHGAFNLKESHGAVGEFLRNLNIYEANSIEQSFYIIEIKESDLIENNDVNYPKRIDLAAMMESGRKLSLMIRPVQDACFYRAVTPRMEIDNSSFSGYIEINEEECPDKEKVVLLYNNRLYGPFEVSSRYSDKKCIHPEAVLKNYLLDYVDASDCHCLEFEIQPYEQNPIPVLFYKFVPNHRKEDVIPDSILLEKLKDHIRPELALENPEEFIRICSTSPFLKDMPEEFRRNRVNRVKELVTRVALHKEDITSLAQELLRQIGRDIPEEMVTASEVYQKQADQLRALYEKQEELQASLEKAREDLGKYEVSMKNASTASNEEVEKLRQELEQFRSQKLLYEDLEALKAEKVHLHAQNDILREEQYKLRAENRSLKKEVQDAITEGFEHRAEKAFDPYISHAMLEAAAKWDRTDETDKLKQTVLLVADQSPAELSGETLISELIQRVQAKRNYKPNTILNIFISIVQNFMTVFSGEPGIGKTSICDILADSIGMNSFADNCLNRYIPVSVERGWQSKRDFIGYFNPLTRRYDKNNSRVYDALRILDTERENSRYPMLILLDEANLSPLEYYWADFMRLADQSEIQNRLINIGTDSDIYIPETLRFLATVNTDQTTEQLSPRFIDRACMIKLPHVTATVTKESGTEKPVFAPIPWKELKEVFDTPKDDKTSPLLSVREKIYELFSQHNLCVSPRVERSIEKYIQVAQGIMDSEGVVRSHEIALDYAVLQKLLPKINGNYDSYRVLFDKLKTISTENHLHMTLEALETMEKFQKDHMGYCQYLA